MSTSHVNWSRNLNYISLICIPAPSRIIKPCNIRIVKKTGIHSWKKLSCQRPYTRYDGALVTTSRDNYFLYLKEVTWARICHFSEVKDEEGRYRGGMGRVYFSLKCGDGVISKFPVWCWKEHKSLWMCSRRIRRLSNEGYGCIWVAELLIPCRKL